MKSTEAPALQQPAARTRRGVLAGAGSAGALAAAAALLPKAQPEPAAAASASPAPEPKDGYRVTQHVLRYYETTRV